MRRLSHRLLIWFLLIPTHCRPLKPQYPTQDAKQWSRFESAYMFAKRFNKIRGGEHHWPFVRVQQQAAILLVVAERRWIMMWHGLGQVIEGGWCRILCVCLTHYLSSSLFHPPSPSVLVTVALMIVFSECMQEFMIPWDVVMLMIGEGDCSCFPAFSVPLDGVFDPTHVRSTIQISHKYFFNLESLVKSPKWGWIGD